jgi:hypothetical protein
MRLRRLLYPTLVFVGVWLVLGIAGELLPFPDPNVLESSADVAALPFWFLGLYVIVVALAPPMHGLHERWGWRVPAALVLGAVIVDIVVHGFGVEQVGFLNYAFVWLLPHQLGFFYADGTLLRLRPPVLSGIALSALAGLITLTAVAGYPTSMIGVPGEDRWNTDPPSLPLVALAVWLIALALLARPALNHGPTTRRLTRANTRVLSMYLWHVSALPLAVLVLYPLGFPRHEAGTSAWWAWRPVWLLGLGGALLLLIAAVGRFEVHPSPEPPPPGRRPLRTAAAALGVVWVAVGLLGFGVTGFDRIVASSGEGVLAFTMTPLLNAVHLALGVSAGGAALAGRGPAPVAWIGAFVSAGIGIAGWSDGITVLGTNRATAVLDLALGLLGAAMLIGFRRVGAGLDP